LHPAPDSADNYFHARRAHIRRILNELAAEIHEALSRSNLPTDVFMTVPTSGESLLTFATLGDPPDDVWAKMSEIVCDVLGVKLNTMLVGREMACAAATATANATSLAVQAETQHEPSSS
jgi:hypothetical protein